jgi:hypothetical protein
MARAVKPSMTLKHAVPLFDVHLGCHTISMVMIAFTVFRPLYEGCVVSIYGPLYSYV